MNIKRILLVSVSIIVVLTVILGAAGFILASNTPAKADEALSNPPAAISEAQSTFDSKAIYEANVAETKDSAPGFKDDSSSDFGCDHDQAIDWYAED